jgi:predicted NUDIX family NTP pyrophosphohydrolase
VVAYAAELGFAIEPVFSSTIEIDWPARCGLSLTIRADDARRSR